jgi:predicted XRE-type DNA-binding protein
MATLFSEQLREAVRQAGLQGKVISELTGIPEAQLSRFMNDKGGLQQSNIDKLCLLIGAKLVPGKPKAPKAKAAKRAKK